MYELFYAQCWTILLRKYSNVDFNRLTICSSASSHQECWGINTSSMFVYASIDYNLLKMKSLTCTLPAASFITLHSAGTLQTISHSWESKPTSASSRRPAALGLKMVAFSVSAVINVVFKSNSILLSLSKMSTSSFRKPAAHSLKMVLLWWMLCSKIILINTSTMPRFSINMGAVTWERYGQVNIFNKPSSTWAIRSTLVVHIF